MSGRDLGLRYWTDRRVTRRRMLAGTAAGGAGLAALAAFGCSSDSNNGNGNGGSPRAQGTARTNDGYQDGTPTAQQRGGILRVRQNPAYPSFNPFAPGIAALAQQLFLGFTVFDHMWYVPTDTGVTELFLATSIEQPDDLTVIAQLGDATFQEKGPVPARAVEAEDVASSFKRFREEAPFGFSWLHEVMDDIVADDPRTVRITQNRPWAWVFTSTNAGSPIFSSILPREVLDDQDFLVDDAVGSGHWMLDSHESGANVKLRRFDRFRTFQNGRDIAGQPYLDGIDFKLITDDNQAIAAFRAGETDVGSFPTRRQMDETVAALGDRIMTGEDLSRDYACLMMRYDPPFTDLRVRKAFNLLLNRDEAIQFIEDGDAVKCGPMPPVHRRYVLPEDDPDLVEYFRTDVNEARQLLEAASFDLDREYELKHSTSGTNPTLARVIQDQLGKGGVKIKLVGEDLVRWFSQTLNQSQFELTCFTHLPYEDPDLPLRFYMTGEGITNFMKYDDADVTAAVLAAASELDEEARVEKVREAQRVIMKAYAPMLNIFSDLSFAARYTYVKGSVTGRGSLGLFNRTTWLDKV